MDLTIKQGYCYHDFERMMDFKQLSSASILMKSELPKGVGVVPNGYTQESVLEVLVNCVKLKYEKVYLFFESILGCCLNNFSLKS